MVGFIHLSPPVPVAASSKVACWNCGFESRRGRGGLSVLSVVCCQVEVSATSWSLVRRGPCVWSRNLKNEGSMARVAPQRHRKVENISLSKAQRIISKLSVKLVVSARGYFYCVKEMSMAVSDKPDGGYYNTMLPSEETEMLDILMVFVFPRNLSGKYYNYTNLLWGTWVLRNTKKKSHLLLGSSRT